MSIRRFVVACSYVLLASGVTGVADAKDAYEGPAVVFAPHANCWRYHGKASDFLISMKAGEKITVTAFGEAHSEVGADEAFTYEKRDVTMTSGADPNIAIDADKDDVIKAPKTGNYSLTLWPHAMQGFDGALAVCRYRAAS